MQNGSALSAARNGACPRHLEPPWTEGFVSRRLLSRFFLLAFFTVILVAVLPVLPIGHKLLPLALTLSRGLAILTSPFDPSAMTTNGTKYQEQKILIPFWAESAGQHTTPAILRGR